MTSKGYSVTYSPTVTHCSRRVVQSYHLLSEVKMAHKFVRGSCTCLRINVFNLNSVNYVTTALSYVKIKNVGNKVTSNVLSYLPRPVRIMESQFGYKFRSINALSPVWMCSFMLSCSPASRSIHIGINNYCTNKSKADKISSTGIDNILSNKSSNNLQESLNATNQSAESSKLEQTRAKFKETTEKFKQTTDRFKEKFEETVMKENIFTIPNLLCVARIILSPILAYLIVHHYYDFALVCFIFAGITDLLDGFIARNFKNQQSMLGSFLDPMADKLLVFCLFLSLTYSNLIPIPLTTLIIARDACLFGAGFYIRYVSLPPPKTLWRYFDATHATAQLSPTLISKINTAVQLMLVAFTLASPVFQIDYPQFFQVMWYLTATTTTISGLSYLYSKKTYHLLKKIKEKADP